MIANKHILKSLPLLAAVLGKKYGINVEIGGKAAFTNGRTITIPSLPSECDSDLLGLVRGYIDHESAHIRHTNFDILKDESITPLEKHIWNTLEDWRVENQLSRIFPGCKQNFNWLIKHLFLSDKDKICSNHLGLNVLNWLLLTVRSWDTPELNARSKKYASIIEEVVPGLTFSLELVLIKVRGSCPDSKACLIYAKEFISILQGITRKSEFKAISKNITSANTGSKTQRSQKEEQSRRNETDQLTRKRLKDLELLLNASEQDLPMDLSSILIKSLKRQPGEIDELIQVAVLGKRGTSAFTQDEIAEVRKATNCMRVKFYSLLQATSLTRSKPARSGRFDYKRLHRALTHNPRLFLADSPTQKINTAVHILLDCSGSMRRRIQLAGQACHAVASALEHVGVNVAVSAFPSVYREGQSHKTIVPVLQHGEQVHHRFKLSASGQTPMGEALWWTLQQMVQLKEGRRIILIITDGKPDSIPTANQALKTGQQLGFEFYGLGILSPEIHSLPLNNSKNINQINELPSAMFEMLQRALTS
ncbi:VWA domain-containing protein [Maridesulfovibrio ferrireducens]|uniref:cobaltochelatase CobT-related protein n=1 Tax=Maridesulfovibrio ferrireducens TaxID=246191 RepID=UPI001A1B9655|nr:VWA domain-containing protein [Maridesulfovibrio ferrireducens]MBI9109956.1 VWA domain-containing protein [Maridesulfovibrio ferrireducens]